MSIKVILSKKNYLVIISLLIILSCTIDYKNDENVSNSLNISQDNSNDWIIEYSITNNKQVYIYANDNGKGSWYNYNIQNINDSNIFWPPKTGLASSPEIYSIPPGEKLTTTIKWDGTCYPSFKIKNGNYKMTVDDIFGKTASGDLTIN